jgi:hypothetical protein
MTVPRIGKFPSAGASTETNVPDAVPVAKPLGRAATLSMYLRYSSLDEKSGRVTGVSPSATVVVAGVAEAPPARTRKKAGAAADDDEALVSGGTNATADPTARPTRNRSARFDDHGNIGVSDILSLRSEEGGSRFPSCCGVSRD